MMMQEGSAAECYDAAMRMLALRAHSAAQLRTKLRRRTFAHEVVESTLERLVASGYLDENDFAEQLVRSRLRRGFGELRISRDLQESGVDSDTSRRALDEAATSEERRAALGVALQKKLSMLRRRNADDDEAVRRKVASFLIRRGFPAAAVIEALDAALAAGSPGTRAGR